MLYPSGSVLTVGRPRSCTPRDRFCGPYNIAIAIIVGAALPLRTPALQLHPVLPEATSGAQRIASAIAIAANAIAIVVAVAGASAIASAIAIAYDIRCHCRSSLRGWRTWVSRDGS